MLPAPAPDDPHVREATQCVLTWGMHTGRSSSYHATFAEAEDALLSEVLWRRREPFRMALRYGPCVYL